MTTKAYDRTNLITGDIVDAEIPHNWILDDLMVFKDLSVACAFEIELPPYVTLNDDVKDYLHSTICSFLNSLEEKYDVQFLWNIKRNCDDVLEEMHKVEPVNKLMKLFHAERIEKIRKAANDNRIRRYSATVSLIHKPLLVEKDFKQRAEKERKLRKEKNVLLEEYKFGKTLLELLGLGTAPEFSKKYEEKEWEQIKDETFGMAASLQATLRDMGLNPRLLVEQDLINTMFEWWNPDAAHKGHGAADVLPDPVPVTQYFTMSEIRMDREKGYLYMDNKVHRILTLRTPPSSLRVNTFQSIVDNLDLPNLRIINNMSPYSREKRIQQLQNRLPLLQARVEKDPKLAVSVEEILTEIYSLSKGEETCWNVTTIFHVWGSTEDEVDSYVQTLKRMGNLSDNAKIVQETHALWRYWLSAQPFWTRDEDLHRAHIFTASQAVCLLPLAGHPEQLIGEKPYAVFDTAYGSLFNFNPLDSQRMNNYNCLLIGSSGTGKSFLAGSIMMAMQTYGARVIGIDLGGSYKSLCEALNGTYITMDPNSKDQTINPLYVDPNEKDEEGNSTVEDGGVSAYQKEQITRFLEKALVAENEVFSKKEKAQIDEVLTNLYLRAGGKEVFLSDLRQAFFKYGKEEMTNLAEIMALWTRGSKFGSLFDGPTKCDFDSPFTMFDMTKIKDNKDIAPLTVMSIMTNVQKMASNYPGVPKILLMDETWFLLQDPVTLQFVAECFRTFRKLNVAIIGVSQGIEEWAQDGASAILNNVLTFIILRQSNPKATEQAARAIGLTPEQVAVIGHLQTIKGEYSQALFYQKRQNGEFSTVIMNRPTPLQYALMTTAPVDKEAIENIRSKQGITYLEARIDFARQFPKGVR